MPDFSQLLSSPLIAVRGPSNQAAHMQTLDVTICSQLTTRDVEMWTDLDQMTPFDTIVYTKTHKSVLRSMQRDHYLPEFFYTWILILSWLLLHLSLLLVFFIDDLFSFKHIILVIFKTELKNKHNPSKSTNSVQTIVAY